MSQLAFRPPVVAGELPQTFLMPGALYCGAGAAVVSTVLGSCVAVCLIDRYGRAAGMNHFVLPRSPAGEANLRYGDVALDRLCEAMGRFGCHPADLIAKVFGGAAVLPVGDAGDTVGTRNLRMAMEWLRHRAITVAARRTGGKNGMLIRLHTRSGRVMLRKIVCRDDHDGGVVHPSYDSRLAAGVVHGWGPMEQDDASS